jgi:cobalt transporter subunit CbtB
MSDRTTARLGDRSIAARASDKAAAAAIAALLGAFILLGVGFLHSAIPHNAAHDSRHSFAFPCH